MVGVPSTERRKKYRQSEQQISGTPVPLSIFMPDYLSIRFFFRASSRAETLGEALELIQIVISNCEIDGDYFVLLFCTRRITIMQVFVSE